MKHFLGIDVSTTASKAIVIDESGTVVASHSVLHKSFSVPGQPLWSEQDPRNWWSATSTAIKETLKTIPEIEIQSIALTGQMQGLVVLDEQYQPLRPAILWNDQRSSKECKIIEKELGKDFLCQHIGTKILPCHSLPKLLWIQENEPDIYKKIKHVLPPKNYVLFCLGGLYPVEGLGDVLTIDPTDACGYATFDVENQKWSSKILNKFKIPESWLPTVFASTAICGNVNAEGAKETGLIAGTPIAAGAGDQPAQSIGCGMVKPGAMSLQIGTSGVVTQIGAYSPAPDGSYLDYRHAEKDQCMTLGLTASAAGSNDWFCQNIAMNYTFKQLDEMASEVAPGSEGLLFIPDICGNIHPHGNALARGHFIGLTKSHTLAHMARAVLEGVAFSMKEIVERMCSTSQYKPDSFIISGGAAKSKLWIEIFRDIMQKPLYTINTNEGAAFGAALIAGVAVNFWPSLEDACAKLIKKSQPIHPNLKQIRQYQRIYPIWKKVYPQLNSINSELASSQNVSDKTVFVFIGGASGSGKTTLAQLLEAKLRMQGRSCSTINMDHYFREKPDDVELKKYLEETIFDTPDMLHLDELKQHLLELHLGQSIARPIFDFATSRRNGTEEIEPHDVIIVEGIFALEFVKKYLQAEALFNLTVHVETDSYIEIVKRRIRRNTHTYKQDVEWLVQQEKKSVGPGFFKYTTAGALHADISVLNNTSKHSDGTLDLDSLNTGLEAMISLLNEIIASTVPRVRKSLPDVKQMVTDSHRDAGYVNDNLIFRK